MANGRPRKCLGPISAVAPSPSESSPSIEVACKVERFVVSHIFTPGLKWLKGQHVESRDSW